MAFDFGSFNNEALNEEFVEWLVDEQSIDIQTHFSRLWDYYQNRMYEPITSGSVENKLNESDRSYIQGQEYGLRARITGIVGWVGGG